MKVHIHDPWGNFQDAKDEFGIELCEKLIHHTYDAIVLAVAHDEYRGRGPEAIRKLGREPHIFFDLKSIFTPDASDLRL